jgi:hypothetical protein
MTRHYVHASKCLHTTIALVSGTRQLFSEKQSMAFVILIEKYCERHGAVCLTEELSETKGSRRNVVERKGGLNIVLMLF